MIMDKENIDNEIKKDKKNVGKKVKEVFLSLLAMFLTCLYPCAFMYLQNVDEVSTKGIYAPLLIYVVVALIAVLFSILFFWNIEKAAVFSCIFMIFFMNFVLIQNVIVRVFPFFTYSMLGIIIAVVLIASIVIIRKKSFDQDMWVILISVIFGGLIMVNILTAIPTMMKGKKVIKPVKIEQFAKNRDVKKNVYYIILDEYSGQDNLDYYYNYDNSDIKNYLEKEGFSWSDTTYNTESISTFEIIPNILNLDYVCEIDGIPNNNLQYTKNPVMYRFFEDMGYEINIVNHENFFITEGYNVLSKCRFSFAEKESDSLSKNIIKQGLVSVISNYMEKEMGMSSQDTKVSAIDLDEVFNCTKKIASYNTGKPAFNICYIQCPHTSFVYDANGNYVDNKDIENFEKKEIYIGQLEYVNTQIKTIVENIKKEDPNSIICFQADHGSRYAYHCMHKYKKKDYDAKKETHMMQNVLNCVYVGGDKKIDIEGETCINTWRKILNEVYGTDYKMLDAPDDYTYKWEYMNLMR